MAKFKGFVKVCPICSNEFRVSPSVSKKIFCSRECYNMYAVGDKNPNFGKRWDDEQKSKQRELVKSKVDEEYKANCAKANKGVKFTAERISRMHEHRNRESYCKPHTGESKAKIAIKSKAKFTDDFKVSFRETMVSRGFWVRDSEVGDYKLYVKLSHWVQRMWDIVSEGADKLREFGVFNAVSNPKGCVRDHKVSKKFGFDNGVFFEILRHPCNCVIIQHGENASKGSKCTISLPELFEQILNYGGEWGEQDLAITQVKRYIGGERLNIKEYYRE